MKYYLSLSFLFALSIKCYAQGKTCACANDSTVYVNCDTQKLKDNSSFLYWQYNCDSAWLTLGTVNGKRIIIDVVRDAPQLTYRLGYDLINEYSNSLLFRADCAANGPCNYVVVDKTNGSLIKDFQQEEDAYVIDYYDMSSYQSYQYDFIAYFIVGSDNLFFYQINERKTLTYPFRRRISYPHPEASFDIVSVKNNVIRMTYRNKKYRKRKIRIKL